MRDEKHEEKKIDKMNRNCAQLMRTNPGRQFRISITMLLLGFVDSNATTTTATTVTPNTRSYSKEKEKLIGFPFSAIYLV